MPGDRTNLDEFVDGFPLDLAKATNETDLLTLFKGGDESAYFCARASEYQKTAILPSRQPVKMLSSNLLPDVGKVKVTTEGGEELSLDEFLAKPEFYSKGYLVIHKGEIVYEKYPRMKAEDVHLWMSCQKTQAGLVIDLLISDGLIDPDKPITEYLTGWKGTEWDNVCTRDVMDMAAGMDIEDTSESRTDPDNIANRVYMAEFGYPSFKTGEVEKLEDVLKCAKKAHGPGEKFEYASGYTQALVFLAEAVSGERWAQLFDKRVWSKIGAEGVMQIHTTPDGIACAHGLASSTLRDMARFGMLYTPSWNKVATEQVVTPAILDRIHKGVRPHDFLMKGFDGEVFKQYHGREDFDGNSHQWDCIWPDGDMWKGGLQTQGLYVSPIKDLVIVYFSVNNDDHSLHRFGRTIATSGFF